MPTAAVAGKVSVNVDDAVDEPGVPKTGVTISVDSKVPLSLKSIHIWFS
jgi:hypothetical protein